MYLFLLMTSDAFGGIKKSHRKAHVTFPGPTRPGKPDSSHYAAAPYGCQTARQYFCGVPGTMALVRLSVVLASVFVDTDAQLVRFVELWIT